MEPFLYKFLSNKNDNDEFQDHLVCEDFLPMVVSSKNQNFGTKLTEVAEETTDDE